MSDATATKSPLNRFHEAQSQPTWGYSTALAEIRAGRKTSHWVWYIFPQLRGLGSSTQSMHFGIAGVAEAEAYLRDPVLGERLVEITRALEAHVCATAAPKSLDDVLGSIDAMKVVSCLTLFTEVARERGALMKPWVATFQKSAERLLAAAAREGHQRCTFTLQKLAASRQP